MGKALEAIRSEPKPLVWLYLLVFLVGLHSLMLGTYIYFFTADFYGRFFAADVDNPFFVRQSGIFLFCLGVFYLYPLVELKKHHALIVLIVFTKMVAVLFMVCNARFTRAPGMIGLAAVGDGMMAMVLAGSYALCRLKRIV